MKKVFASVIFIALIFSFATYYESQKVQWLDVHFKRKMQVDTLVLRPINLGISPSFAKYGNDILYTLTADNTKLVTYSATANKISEAAIFTSEPATSITLNKRKLFYVSTNRKIGVYNIDSLAQAPVLYDVHKTTFIRALPIAATEVLVKLFSVNALKSHAFGKLNMKNGVLEPTGEQQESKDGGMNSDGYFVQDSLYNYYVMSLNSRVVVFDKHGNYLYERQSIAHFNKKYKVRSTGHGYSWGEPIKILNNAAASNGKYVFITCFITGDGNRSVHPFLDVYESGSLNYVHSYQLPIKESIKCLSVANSTLYILTDSGQLLTGNIKL